MVSATKARAVGFNHVTTGVGDIDAALAFCGRLFEFHLRSKTTRWPFWRTTDHLSGARQEVEIRA